MRENRILIKLIDEAVLPAFLILAAKVISLFALIRAFQVVFTFSTSTLLPLLTFENQSDLIFVNTHSNLFMLGVVCVGVIFCLARAHLTHDTHIHPGLTLKLLTLNWGGLIVTTFEIYHQSVVWLLFLWFSVLIFTLQGLAGISQIWLVMVSLVIGFVLTGFFILDVEREVRHEKSFKLNL